jgi:acyl-coenzyme A synthetase/AMP-(fatty) acid ligase
VTSLPRAAAIFSSGGPLEAEASVPWLRWTPNGVIEIYGSTETGGIGWRVQRALGQPAPWTPFPDLSLSREPDGALRVLSPRAGAEAVRMEDRVEWVPGGGFLLRGRLDRIVKVEEKRVSLPEVEAALEAHPWVRRAALTLLDGPRQVLGAVVVLSREGRSAAQDRHRLCQELRGHLAVRFEGVALPRRWRFPEELPFNERGKLAPADLAALFLASGTKEESLP